MEQSEVPPKAAADSRVGRAGGAVVAGGSRCSVATGARARGRLDATTGGKICTPCMIRGVRAAKGAPSWQDTCAVYSQTAACRAFRIHGAHILPKPAHFGYMARESCHELAIFPSEAIFGMHGAQNLLRIDAQERTAAESCHGKTPENASRENIATVGRWGTHFASILPSASARERIAAKYCQQAGLSPSVC